MFLLLRFAFFLLELGEIRVKNCFCSGPTVWGIPGMLDLIYICTTPGHNSVMIWLKPLGGDRHDCWGVRHSMFLPLRWG